MSVYKVPQDVEAEDKLVGPFTFRQFMYALIVAGAGGLAYALGRLALPLAFIPTPVILLFGALALPLRKDQPMETYLAAIVSFFLKPRIRRWDPDGIDATIEITAPKIVEFQRTKDFSQSEAETRIGYLAKIVDSQGWAIRGTGSQAPNNSMVTDAYYSAQEVEDVMDENNAASKSLTQMLELSDIKHHKQMLNIASGLEQAPVRYESHPPRLQQNDALPVDYFGNFVYDQKLPPDETQPMPDEKIERTLESIGYDPYPEEMHQTVIKPLSEQNIPTINPIQKQPETSEKPLPADIINLANNTDLSIEAIAREANRIQKKRDPIGEVYVSLR